MAELTVTISSHNFALVRITPRGRAAAESFAKKNVQFGFARGPNNKYQYMALKVFAAASNDRSEFRFHINQFKEFQEHLKIHSLTGDLVEFIYIPIPEPVKVEFKVLPKWSDRDYQTPVIEYIVNDKAPLLKFVSLQTGLGKSYCSMRAMEILGYRTLIVVKPMYIEKWQEDILRTYDIDPEDILIVKGGAQLMKLLILGQDNELTAKIIILSNKTMQLWITLYEKFKEGTLDLGYACTPDRLCEVIGAGIRLIDEVHQDFHFNYKLDCYTNVKRSISLSATLVSDDDFINKMYAIPYPPAMQYKGPAYDKYISAKAIIYRLRYPEQVRCKDPATKNYSHHLFEQSILRNKTLTANYFNLINQCIKGSYLTNYKKGEKLIIFCASIAMCTLVKEYLEKLYPNHDVRRYVESDPYENLMDADIRVTTLQSAGTAVDIANLTTTILTTAVSSSQSNIQGLGRLRKLEGTTPEFLYFACEDIPKHIDYHERKKMLLKDMVLHYKAIFIPGSI